MRTILTDHSPLYELNDPTKVFDASWQGNVVTSNRLPQVR